MSALLWTAGGLAYAAIIAIVARCCAINRLDDGAQQ